MSGRWSFDTLIVRTLVASLVSITLVHMASLWFHERALDRELTIAHDARLAERIVALKRSLTLAPTTQRETMAHELSGGPISAHWTPLPATAQGHTSSPEWQRLAAEIRRQAPDLGADGLLIGTSAARDPHITLVSVRLPDASWLNVSLFAATRPPSHLHSTLFSTSLMGLGVVLLSVLIAHWLTRPIRAIAAAASGLTPDRPVTKVPETGPREVRDLAAAFNDMQARIADLVARRTQALGAVSHDLRTPLTRLKLRLEDLPASDLQRAATADIDEMEQMVEATLAYLRGEDTSEPTRRLDLGALLGSIVNDARDAGRNADLDATANLIVAARRISLKRAISNLVSNALRFGTEVMVRATSHDGNIHIAIDDNGPGIPEDQLATVLEPFVRLEHSRNRETGGVGLGLTIARSNIEAHGGTLTLANRPEGGLRALVILPRAA